jgi:hypothetical protein
MNKFIEAARIEQSKLEAKNSDAFTRACKTRPEDTQWAHLLISTKSIGRKMRDYRNGFVLDVCAADVTFKLAFCEPKKGEDFGHFEIRANGRLLDSLPATSATLDAALNTLARYTAQSM